jgi:hypothetical protein
VSGSRKISSNCADDLFVAAGLAINAFSLKVNDVKFISVYFIPQESPTRRSATRRAQPNKFKKFPTHRKTQRMKETLSVGFFNPLEKSLLLGNDSTLKR